MKREDIEKQLNLLERVAEKLKNGLITSGNVAHDGKVQGYTIENVVSNIRKILDKEEPTNDELEKEILKEWHKHAHYHSDYKTDIVQVFLEGYQDTARHFANWQKSQPQLEKLVNTSYENGYKQCKEDMVKNAIDAEILEVEDVSYSMNAHTHLEISTDEDLEENYKDGDKLSLIILKKE